MSPSEPGPPSLHDTQPLLAATPAEFRSAVRQGRWRKPTSGCCSGFTQLNLVVLPQRYAADFQDFCTRNPQPCPLLETVGPGQVEAVQLAPGSDLRTDCPGYKVFRGGQAEFRENVTDIWQDDFVSFLIGCSFTFEQALLAHGIPIRHIERGCNVPMYVTNRPCVPAGPFHGQMVVSMRPIPEALVELACTVTGRYPGVHGAPVHCGDPQALGIADLARPDFGDPVPVLPGETPVFWACGVTPQVALMNLAPEIAITHAPGFMFVSDRRDEDFRVD